MPPHASDGRLDAVNERVLRENIARVADRIAAAARRSGRRPEDIRVLPITKGHPTSVIPLVAAVGFAAIGENRVDEAEAKLAQLGRADVRWHLVGHLQRNKAARAVRAFDLIESVDSRALGRRLHDVAERLGLGKVRVLVQVNASGERQKKGLPPAEVVDVVGELMRLDRLAIEGLMTMAPLTADEKVLRDTFATTRECLRDCGTKIGLVGDTLSMGMSNDFEIAVEEGSTEVRLGTVLLGERRGR